jgi:general L-amino acid transport system substrate-binding protein
MVKKVLFPLTILLVLALLVSACGTPPPEEPLQTDPTPAPQDTPADSPPAQQPGQQMPTGYGTIVQRILSRGSLVCGSRTDLPAFGFLDGARNVGFDVDLCRAVAAAMLGNADAVEFVPISTAERGPALQTGEIDMLSRNATWTSSREVQWGNFTWIMFFDGQGFMVREADNITSIEDLSGATVCVTTGTTTELNLADAFRERGMNFTPVTFEDLPSVYGAYQDGRCDAATSDKSQLAAARTGFTNPNDHIILDITISKEPLTPAVPAGDDQWFDIVRVVLWGLINAEELGVNQNNVDAMLTSDSVEVRRLLGAESDWGQADLGLPADAIARAIRAVGNYGEIYDRYMGPQGMSFTLERGDNRLWTNGGLIYAPPLR